MTFIIGTPHTHGAGYHMNDDRLSGGTLDQNDVQTCPHCQAVILMQKWAKSSTQNFCVQCMKPTCDAPECVNECIPFIKRFSITYDALQKYYQYLKLAGFAPTEVPAPQLYKG